MKWFKIILEGSFYEGMIGRLVLEEPRAMTLDFGGTIKTAIFMKEYCIEEHID